MNVHDYSITDSFIGALRTICKHCTGRSCYTCEVFELRVNAESVSKCESTLDEDHSYFVIPDSFAFHTKINRLTEHDIYYAQRDEDQYIVILPSIGCVYRFSVEHMKKQIVMKNYIIVPQKA